VRLQNLKEETIEVLVSTTGKHFSASPDTLRIDAGTMQTVSVRFAAGQPGSYQGVLSLQVKGFFKGENSEIPLRARAVAPLLTIAPQQGLDFGEIPLGQTASAHFRLTNTGEVTVVLDSLRLAQIPSPFRLSTPLPSALAPQEQIELALEFMPERGGDYDNRLLVITPDLDGIELNLSARALAPRLAISPLPQVGIDYETVELGQSLLRKVTLINVGRANLQIHSAEVSGHGFLNPGTPLLTTLAPEERLQLSIAFQPDPFDQRRLHHLHADRSI
jgi:hypothetical protein